MVLDEYFREETNQLNFDSIWQSRSLSLNGSILFWWLIENTFIPGRFGFCYSNFFLSLILTGKSILLKLRSFSYCFTSLISSECLSLQLRMFLSTDHMKQFSSFLFLRLIIAFFRIKTSGSGIKDDPFNLTKLGFVLNSMNF